MKIHILSDLHVEFSQFIFQPDGADVIVLAGDIGKGVLGIQWAEALLDKTDADVLFVNGNHEYYGQDLDSFIADMREYCDKVAAQRGVRRLHFMENDELVIQSVRFLGATMWMDFMLFGPEKRRWCLDEARYLNDFRLIRKDDGLRRFSTQDAMEMHRRSLQWLTDKLDTPFDGHTVVVTHHLPSFESVATRYSDDLFTACFASRLDHLFGKMDVWIHGHTHDSFDYVKNGTRVICNPRGYSRHEEDIENYGFDPMLTVEI
jgi:predicted phosphodiesterase